MKTTQGAVSRYSSIVLCCLAVWFGHVTISAQNLPAPTLIAPPNGATGVSTTPTFSWSAVTGASAGYWLAVATSSGALPTLPTDSTCPSCVIMQTVSSISYTPPSPLSPGTTYFWKVRGRGPGTIYGNWSTTFSFTTLVPTPVITSISTTPSPPTTAGAFTFTINGNNFYPAGVLIVVTGPGCTPCTIPNSALTTKTTTTLAGSYTLSTAGTYSFVVQNGFNPQTGGPGPQSAGVNVTVSGVTPTITSVSPNPVTGSTSPQTVTINGANFVNKPSVTVTSLGTLPASAVTFVSSTQLTMLITTQNNPDNWTVQVTNPSGGGSSSAFPFRIKAATPVITSLITSPNPPTTAGAFTFTINGSGFSPAIALILVTGPGCTPCSIANSALTTKTTTTLAGSYTLSTAGTYSFVVQNGFDSQTGGPGPQSAGVNVTVSGVTPTITSVSPNPVTGSTSPQTVTINGANFVNKPTVTVTSGAGSSTLAASAVTFVNSTQLTMQITTSNDPYIWAVQVTNPSGGGSSSAFPFRVKAATPVITSLITSPSPPTTAGAFTFTINGSGFSPAIALILVTGPGCAPCTIANSALTAKTTTTLAGSYTLATAGTYSFVVQNGFDTQTGGPGPQSAGVNVTVAGVNQPNLTAYLPPGWSDKIVVSRAPGNNTDSTSLTAADTLYVDWAVVNFGTAGAGAFSVSLSVDNVVKASWSVPSLSANYYQPVFDYNLGSLGSGQHMIKITADSTGAITESSEADNSYTKTINIGGSSLPDFRVTGIALNPASPQPGQAFKANVTVKNEGTGSGDGGWLDGWAHQTSAQSCGVDGNTWFAVGTLTAGQIKTYTLDLIASGTAGSYTCRAFVDSACKTAESDDGDNQTTFPYTVGSISQPLPNFVVTAITFNPAQPVGGQPFTASVTVQNQGAVSGDGKYLDVWANQPSSQTCGAPGGQSQAVGTLSVNQTKTLTYNLIAPPSGAPWTFRAYVDSTCQTPESSDGDNQRIASYGINPVAQPDFTITTITTSPSNLKPGEKFSAFVTVKNLGVSGNAGSLDVWANKPTAATCGETGNRFSIVGTLAANETRVIPIANLTAGPSGNNTVRAFIDSKCASTESSEVNNQKTFDYKTSQRVLVLLHGMNAGPDTWEDYVDTRFGGSAPIINGGQPVSRPIPDVNGVVCYRVDFGWYERNGPRTGVGGVLAGTDEKHGDFSTFTQLGDEVWDAIHYILSPDVYPGAQITLLGHSRGGLAARAFLQKAGSSPEKASVVALLTTGTPHKGSRLGRIYSYLVYHPENTASGHYWAQDWDVVNFLRGYKACVTYVKYNIDLTYPTLEDVADNSTAIINLQNTIHLLPIGIKYGAITYTGKDLGVLDNTLAGQYRVFDVPWSYNVCYQLSSGADQAEDTILDAGKNGDDYPGDGIVPLTSQRFDDIPGFPAGNNYSPFPHTGGILHTEETGTEAHLNDALNSLIDW